MEPPNLAVKDNDKNQNGEDYMELEQIMGID